MNIDAARTALTGILRASPHNGAEIRRARAFLLDRGIEATGLSGGLSLNDVISAAARAPRTAAIRDFAVLLVHALGIDGLLSTRGQAERELHAFLEHALLNPLRRALYPFDGPAYDKRQALGRLHATIDEHLRPPDLTFPRWINDPDPPKMA